MRGSAAGALPRLPGLRLLLAQRIARAVHFLDIGGIPVPEAAGLEAVLSGLREVHADDDQLTLAAAAVFDALHAAPGTPT